MKALRRLMLNMKWRKFSSQMIMTGRRETLKMRMMLEQRIRNLLMRESLTGRKCSLREGRRQFYAQVFKCYKNPNELCKI